MIQLAGEILCEGSWIGGRVPGCVLIDIAEFLRASRSAECSRTEQDKRSEKEFDGITTDSGHDVRVGRRFTR